VRGPDRAIKRPSGSGTGQPHGQAGGTSCAGHVLSQVGQCWRLTAKGRWTVKLHRPKSRRVTIGCSVLPNPWGASQLLLVGLIRRAAQVLEARRAKVSMASLVIAAQHFLLASWSPEPCSGKSSNQSHGRKTHSLL
jgi:hypothetical protein